MEFIVGGTPVGPDLRRQYPPTLGYLPGFGAVRDAIRALLRSPTKIAAASAVITAIAGDYAQYLVKNIPHQGPGQDGIPYPPGVGGDTVYLLWYLGQIGAIPSGSSRPGDVEMLPMWRADP